VKQILNQVIIRFKLLITALYTLLSVFGYSQTTLDSLKNQKDTLRNTIDTTKGGFDLNAEVMYSAADSIAYSPKSQLIILYGKSKVTYESQVMEANYMEIDMKKNEVLAIGKTDSTGKIIEKVKFKDGENEMEASEIRYNMKTKRGKVKEVFTNEGEAYIHMAEAKKQANNEVHLHNGKFTTCSNEIPHYHFRMRKAIIIPDDKIVTGPVYMVIGKVPTPLALPFGYFPNKKGNVQGIIIPQYGDSPTYGFFLQNGGYYLPVGEKVDMQFLGDIYSRGSWALKQITRYKIRYKYSGLLNLSFSQFRVGDKDFIDFSKKNEFFVRWSHNQDPKSKPGSRFAANVNFGTLTNFQNNFNTFAQDYLSSSFQSNVSYTRTWIGTPFSLTTNLRHNQNTLAKTITVTVPELTLNVARFFPLAVLKENKVSPNAFAKALGNVGISFASNVRNDVSAGDSLYSLNGFNSLIKNYSRNGIKHNASVGTTLKLLGDRFTFNPAANFTERWYMQALNKSFVGTELQTDTLREFSRNFEYSFNGSLTTRMFGMYSTRKAGGPKLRHIFTPSVNFSYRPDFNTSKTITDGIDQSVTFSPYELGVFGRPSSGESGTVGMTFVNSLEMKKRSANDTVTGFVKIPIIENFQINGNYDLIRDSLNLSNIQFSARNTFFKVLSINYLSVLDPYHYNQGKITREYQWSKGKGLGRVTMNNLAVNYTFKAKPRKKKVEPKNLNEDEKEEVENIKRNTAGYIDYDVPFSLTATYNLNFNRVFIGTLDTVLTTQSVGLNGDVGITKKLKIGFITNYDFTAKEISYTQFSLYYDLHCWEFSTQVIPFGLRKSYVITLNVKASILQDLRLQRRRSWVDLN
jgi:lipopolysaccharide export system protein LptA